MKGINTSIVYRSQSATLREAKLSGMVVGIPISTEQRKQISIEASEDLTKASATAQPEISIYGLNPAFDFVDGDVIYGAGLRMWIRKSSEAKTAAVEMNVTITDNDHYGTAEDELCTIKPVVDRAIPNGTTAAYSATTGEITFSNVIPGIASGDTIYGTDAVSPVAVARIGKIGTPRTVGATTVAPVTWLLTTEAAVTWTRVTTAVTIAHTSHGYLAGESVTISDTSDAAAIPNGVYVIQSKTDNAYVLTGLNGGASSGTAKDQSYVATGAITVSGIYYDYASDPLTETARGYVMYFDSIVYRTSVFGVKVMSSPDDLATLFGDNSVENPLSNLAMGASLFTLANGMKDKFKICALDLRNVSGLDEESPQDIMETALYWSNAATKVDAHKDAYFLTTMTNNETIQDAWEAYVNTSSATARRRQKRYWVAKNIINGGSINYTPGNDDQYIIETFGNGKYGDADYAVDAKYDEGYDLDGTQTYFDKDADVEAALATPMATNNERVTYIGCEFATMGNVNLDGYYISAIIAGWRASNPLGYVADDMAVPLITGIPSSGGYYTEEDLDALHMAGWYMLNQDIDSSPVTCYIQSTTAYDNTDKAEESLVVALDYALKDCCETLAPYIKGGLENRVSATNPESPRTVAFLAKLNAALAIVRYKYITTLNVFAVMEVVSVKVNELSGEATDVVFRFVNYKQVREINITAYVE